MDENLEKTKEDKIEKKQPEGLEKPGKAKTPHFKSEPSTEEAQSIVRIIDKDVPGDTSIWKALTKVRGISFMLSSAICTVLDLDRSTKVGNLTPEQIAKIEDCAKNPAKYGIPPWLFNRRKDLESGEDKHLVSADLLLQKSFDIRFLKKIRCYRGIRHGKGLKVRGQRTRTTGRKGKTLGVKRKKKGAPSAAPAAPAKEEKGGKK